MTKASYMALDDYQTLWTNSIKPWIISYAGTIVTYPLEASIGGVITDITVIL